MSDILDLANINIISQEVVSQPSVLFFVNTNSISSEESFGYGVLYDPDSYNIVDANEIKIVDLSTRPIPGGIPSQESFDHITIGQGIPAQTQFGATSLVRIIAVPSFSTVSVGDVPRVELKNISIAGITTKEAFGIPKVKILNDIPGTNVVVASQFPEFVREDHPRFINFIEAYYTWLESKGNVLYEARRLKDYRDIDTSVDEFVEQLFKEYLPSIPRTALADKKILLKYIKQFYRAKGTEKSYKFFFRMLYNVNSEFYYPRTDILRTSDGKWIQNVTIRITNVVGDVKNLLSQRIRGQNKNCTAFVERVTGIQEGYMAGYELFLNRSSITGKFQPNETIVTEDGSVTATISPIPVSVDITNGGTGYEVGDVFAISGGLGGIAEVKAVGELGDIKKIEILNYGLGYATDSISSIDFTTPVKKIANPLSTIQNNITKIIAQGIVNIGSTTKYPGYYLNEDGQLSTTKYIQDGNYYQQFSYVTWVNESLGQYKELLHQLIHPAGLKHFGGVRIQDLLQTKLKNPGNTNTPVIRHVTSLPLKHRIHMNVNTIVKHEVIKDKKSFGLGASLNSIFRNRFKYKPFEQYDANLEMLGAGSNANYYGVYDDLSNQKSSTPIKLFMHMRPIDIEKHTPWMPINMMPDSFVRAEWCVRIGAISLDSFFGTCSITSN